MKIFDLALFDFKTRASVISQDKTNYMDLPNPCYSLIKRIYVNFVCLHLVKSLKPYACTFHDSARELFHASPQTIYGNSLCLPIFRSMQFLLKINFIPM